MTVIPGVQGLPLLATPGSRMGEHLLDMAGHVLVWGNSPNVAAILSELGIYRSMYRSTYPSIYIYIHMYVYILVCVLYMCIYIYIHIYVPIMFVVLNIGSRSFAPNWYRLHKDWTFPTLAVWLDGCDRLLIVSPNFRALKRTISRQCLVAWAGNSQNVGSYSRTYQPGIDDCDAGFLHLFRGTPCK